MIESNAYQIPTEEFSSSHLATFAIDGTRRTNPDKSPVENQPNSSEIPFWLLPGTGFFVEQEVDKFLEGLKGKSKYEQEAAVDKGLAKIRISILSYEQEFLRQLPVLPIVLGTKNVNGEAKFSCPEWGDELLEDVTIKQEREGAVWNSFFKKKQDGGAGVQEALLSGEKDLAVIVSPKGWTNLYDIEGNEISHKDNQIYVLTKNGGFALRNNLNLEQSRELLKNLGVPINFSNQSIKTRIKTIVEHPALLKTKDKNSSVRSALDVLNIVEDIQKTKHIHLDKTFEHAKQLLSNPSLLFNTKENTIEHLGKFETAVKQLLKENDPNSIRFQIEKLIGYTVLDISEAYSKFKSIKEAVIYDANSKDSSSYMYDFQKYSGTLSYMQTLPGCSSSGDRKSTFLSTSLGLREVGEDQYGSLEFTCDKCSKVNVRPLGKLLTNCQHCGKNVQCV